MVAMGPSAMPAVSTVTAITITMTRTTRSTATSRFQAGGSCDAASVALAVMSQAKPARPCNRLVFSAVSASPRVVIAACKITSPPANTPAATLASAALPAVALAVMVCVNDSRWLAKLSVVASSPMDAENPSALAVAAASLARVTLASASSP